MAKYLISFPSAAMVVPDGEWEAVGRDAHAVIEEAKAATDAGATTLDAKRRPRIVPGSRLSGATPASEECVELLHVGIGKRTDLGPHPLGEEGQDVGTDAVGLREPRCGPGEVAYLPRIDHVRIRDRPSRSSGRGRPPQLCSLLRRKDRDAVPASAGCSPPRRHRAGTRRIPAAESATR